MDEPQSRLMVNRFGIHRADETDIIRDAARVRQQLRELHPALAELLELVRAAETIAFLLVEVNFQVAPGIRLAVVLCQQRLGIEQVHLAWSAMLEQADDRAGLRFGR